MGQGMYQFEIGVVECYVCQILVKGYLFVGLQIVFIVYCFWQLQVNQMNGFEGVGVGQWMGVNGDKGFDGVGQGIYVGGGGNGWWNVEYYVGVVDGDIWDQVWVDNYFFYLLFVIDNYCVVGYFCCCVGGGIDGYQWYVSVFYFVDVGVGGGGVWVGGEDFYCFGGINWVIVVEGDQVIVVGCLVSCIVLLYQCFGGVGEYFVKQLISYLLFIQCGEQVVQQVQFYQLIVGDDQCFVLLFVCYQFDYIIDCVCVVEVDFRQC